MTTHWPSRFAVAVTMTLGCAAGRRVCAQEPAPLHKSATMVAAEPRYDVVSIAPNKSESGNSGVTTHDESFSAENVSLKSLLSGAYGIRQGLISGIPGWADTARYDIKAKIVDPDTVALKQLTREQRRAMLAAILEDRFQVRVHTETKVIAVYDLVVTKGGPKLKATPRPPQPSDGSTSPEKGSGGGYSSSDTNMIAHALQISSLVEWLSGQLNRTVIDKTALTGEYDFQINFSATSAELSGEDDGRRKSDEAAPSLFTAVQEQLGLRLESTKGPVETLVVDHVEPPSAN